MDATRTVPEEKRRRPIRSYVRREGRMTKAQRRALEQLWPRYGVEAGRGALDFSALFGRRAPVVLEIGFGDGKDLAAMAARYPQNDYLGIEVHRPGVGSLLLQLEANKIRNVRVLCADATEVVADIPEASLDAVHIFFPDPWPKKRHHKRRLIQPKFVRALGRSLKPGGRLHVATDWREYAEHILAVMKEVPGFRNVAGEGCFAPRPDDRPLTKYETRGMRLGHEVFDLIFERV